MQVEPNTETKPRSQPRKLRQTSASVITMNDTRDSPFIRSNVAITVLVRLSVKPKRKPLFYVPDSVSRVPYRLERWRLSRKVGPIRRNVEHTIAEKAQACNPFWGLSS
ncbi:uncharacterized protein UDID_01345 [Ustilago sp. UG-2017a]|nr:uncharacterized protein UDID_01345 [Ustilago sp. UG-2017a]